MVGDDLGGRIRRLKGLGDVDSDGAVGKSPLMRSRDGRFAELE